MQNYDECIIEEKQEHSDFEYFRTFCETIGYELFYW